MQAEDADKEDEVEGHRNRKERSARKVKNKVAAAQRRQGSDQGKAKAPAAPPPAWKQGMPAEMANSTLAPLAGKLTVLSLIQT